VSLYKRDKVWWFGFVHAGQRVQKSTNQGNKNVARSMELAFHTALVKGEVGITEKKQIPTFKAAMTDFLKWSEKEHAAKPATHRRHQISSVALLKHFKDVALDQIRPDEVERFKSARLGQFKTVRGKNNKRRQTDSKIQPATVNRELACLRALFNHVIKADVPVKNPISKTAAKTLQEHNEQTRVLSYDEQRKYLAHATPMLRDVATLMLETGMRPEEVYRIQPTDIELAADRLHVRRGKTKAAKRRIRLTKAAKFILKRLNEECKDQQRPYLFPHADDPTQPVPKMNSAHDRAVKSSKVAPFRLYDLRHTWATRASEAGVDLVTLAAMLGHSKINMVLRYAHPTQAHQTAAMKKMEHYVLAQSLNSERR
jgi:integrase